MAGKQGTKVLSGTTEVANAGTAAKLISTSQEFATIGVWVSADAGNTGNVVIGDSAVKAKTKEQKGVTVVKATTPIFIEVGDPNILFADVETSKDKVSWLAIFA